LRKGGSALDAVEQAARQIESNALDTSVGVGGLPNVLGQVELDASIMDGSTLASGAVGALQGYEHPISVARMVMEHTPHVFLVGAGAAHFAQEMGLPTAELLTEQSRASWQAALSPFGGPADAQTIHHRPDLAGLVTRLSRVPREHGTVNFLARDKCGNLASAVSTSGWPWKYPGRLGDSPVIGAGNYADSRYGAATCTGHGELAIRCSTARSVVLYLKMGLSLEQACQAAMEDLRPLLGPQAGPLTLLAITAQGSTFGMTTDRDEMPYLLVGGRGDQLLRMRYVHCPPVSCESQA
jgi:beta-aspartyl-peptidase (threonine type)